MNSIVRFMDTTLRDGEQTPGIRFTQSQKLEIAKRLATLGTDIIEAGFPAASTGDFEAVLQISENIKGPVICALARASAADIDSAAKALRKAEKSRIHVFIATSDIHLEHKLRLTREEVIEKIYSSVKYASSLSADVQFSAEDATRTDPEFLSEAVRTAISAGAKIINIPDTVGYMVPEEYSSLLRRLLLSVPELEGITLSTHCHNDLGLASANTLSAVAAGARQIECTVNGLGERAGNAALEELAVALSVKYGDSGIIHNIDNKELIRTSRLVSSLSGVYPAPNKAVVGSNAFTHASGIHQHGIMRSRDTYEIIDPAEIGLTSDTMVLGKLSGKHAFSNRIASLGYTLDGDAITSVFNRFKEVADKKSQMTDEDIRAIISEYLDGLEGKFRINSFQIQSGNKMKAMALITLSSGEELITEAAPGEGPIDASFNAVNRISGATGRLELISYGISAVTEGTDALGEAKVKVRDGDAVYTGRGVSTDIIKASIKAYLNAVNKWYAVTFDSLENNNSDK